MWKLSASVECLFTKWLVLPAVIMITNGAIRPSTE